MVSLGSKGTVVLWVVVPVVTLEMISALGCGVYYRPPCLTGKGFVVVVDGDMRLEYLWESAACKRR